MRVLLIEDEESTAKSIEITLASEGIICDKAQRGTEGIEISQVYDYDIIILDLMLPDIEGYDVLLRLRAAKVRIPILILSGLSSVDKKIKGLGFGADDYMTKPFNNRELIARIQAIVRRSKGYSESIIRFSKVMINLDTRRVEVDGKEVHLTNKEYETLELLAVRKGTVLTKEMFVHHLYPGAEPTDSKIVDVFVCKVRKKLADAGSNDDCIETVWGRGYTMKEYESTAPYENQLQQQIITQQQSISEDSKILEYNEEEALEYINQTEKEKVLEEI